MTSQRKATPEESINTSAPPWFDTNKGNLLQFLGILVLTLGIPFLLFDGTRTLGLVLCPVGASLYGLGRFANWYFWYRSQ